MEHIQRMIAAIHAIGFMNTIEGKCQTTHRKHPGEY
jgi:hypothetical protein